MYLLKNIITKIFFVIFFNIPLFSSEIYLPKPTGAYSVGVTNVELSDASRFMLRSHGKRRWMATLFYPAENHLEHSFYMPGTLENGFVENVKVKTFSKCDAKPLSSKFPVIIFIPGRGNERQIYTILCESLASHGYVVISMDMPYVANFVGFPDQQKIVLTFKDAWNIPRDRDYRYRYDDLVIKETMKDIDYVLNTFKTIKVLAQIGDFSKIIVMGHSIGANVAHHFGFLDSRIKAIVDIDSKITERKVYGYVGVPPNLFKKPILFMRGQMQYQEDIGNCLEKVPTATIFKPLVQHSAFSDTAYFAKKINDFGNHGFFSNVYRWFFKKGPIFSNVDTSLGKYDVDEWFKIYPHFIINWLSKNTTK